MKPQQYLTHLLRNSGKTNLSKKDRETLDNSGLEEFIFRKLTTKKFRKYKLQPGCEARTRQAVKTKLDEDKPIQVIYPQGGYKLWRLPTWPKADWAEFFNISYLLRYIAPIAAAYKPGVNLTYYMHTLLMEKHDNLTTQEIQDYVDSFQNLIDAFSEHLPGNIKIDILKDADLYSREEYFQALEKGVVPASKQYEDLSSQKKKSLKEMSLLNIKWDGAEDWTSLSLSEKENKLKMAAIYEMSAVHHLDKVFEEVKAPDKVLAFTSATSDFIGIGTCKASIAKYWVGFGVLVEKKDSYYPVILAPSQFKKALKKKHTTEKTTIISDDNFSEILIFNRPFTFHKQ